MMRIVLPALVLLGLVPLVGCYAAGERMPSGSDAGEDGSTSLDAGSTGPDGATTDDGGTDSGASVDGGNACTAFATEVVDHAFGTGQNHNQTTGFPNAIFGPPNANEVTSVVSLGNGGWVELSFDGRAIVDGPGADFLVFENPFPNFVELATVSVSDDGVTWHEFPCTAAQSGPDYGACAGVHQVFSKPTNGISPFDPAVSGGDAYDLADLGVTSARYVRIVDRVDLDGPAGVFDLDAVAVRHTDCP